MCKHWPGNLNSRPDDETQRHGGDSKPDGKQIGNRNPGQQIFDQKER